MARQMPRSHTTGQLDAPVVPQDGAGARLGVGVLEATTFNREDMMGGGEGMCALLGGDVPCTRNTSLPLIRSVGARSGGMGGGEGMCALLGVDGPCTRNTSLPLIAARDDRGGGGEALGPRCPPPPIAVRSGLLTAVRSGLLTWGWRCWCGAGMATYTQASPGPKMSSTRRLRTAVTAVLP